MYFLLSNLDIINHKKEKTTKPRKKTLKDIFYIKLTNKSTKKRNY